MFYFSIQNEPMVEQQRELMVNATVGYIESCKWHHGSLLLLGQGLSLKLYETHSDSCF